MKKYIINMLLAIIFAAATQAQTTLNVSPSSATICVGNKTTFTSVANVDSLTGSWQYSIDGGATWAIINGNTPYFSTIITKVDDHQDAIEVRVEKFNVKQEFGPVSLKRETIDHLSGKLVTSNIVTLTINSIADNLYITKPNSTPTCVGNSFQLAGSLPNGVFSSSNSNVAGISCNGVVNVKTQGTANINYIYTATNGCKDTATYALNTTNPTPATVSGATSVCVGGFETYTANVANGMWSCDQSSQATLNTTGTLLAKSAGYAIVNYTIVNTAGCRMTTNYQVKVNATPAAPLIAYASGTPLTGSTSLFYGAPAGSFCVGKTFSLVGSPAGGIFSATGAASVTGNTVTINSVGSGTVKYSYTNAIGCVSSRTISGNGFACAARMSTIDSRQSTTDFVLYPNPASSVVRLQMEKFTGFGNIIVTDLYGKKIKMQPLSVGVNNIDISSLSKGFYLITVSTNEGDKTQKLIVE